MAKMQRDKGRAFEQWVVRQFKAAGFHAERTAPMQAGDGAGYGDVVVMWQSVDSSRLLLSLPPKPVYIQNEIHLECKHHADLPAYLWEPDPFANRPVPQYLTEWLDGNDAVVFKGHGRKYPAMVFLWGFHGTVSNPPGQYYVIPLADYIEGLR